MQTAKDWRRCNSATLRYAMPLGLKLGLWRTGIIRRSRSEAGVCAGAIVMLHLTCDSLPNVWLADRNHAIQAVAADTAAPASANGIRLGRFVGSLQDCQPQRS